jgi:mycothiol synthase
VETPVLAPGYAIRPATPGDVDAVRTVTVASDEVEFSRAEGDSIEEIRDTWATLELDRDTWLAIAPDGSVVAYGYLYNRRNVRMDAVIYVHPDHVGKGIGTTLVRLSEGRARERVPFAPEGAEVVLNNWISGTNDDARSLLERNGFHPNRFFHRHEIDLDEMLPAPAWPEGITVRSFGADNDGPRFHATFEEAWADHWGYVPSSYEEWRTANMGETFDPGLWFLAEHDDEPAGFALCGIIEGMGWVDFLTVRRPWRRRGLGMALLRHAMAEFRHRGLPRMALNVDTDNPTGATQLYERAGMHVTQLHAVYRKVLRPGHEPAPGQS